MQRIILTILIILGGTSAMAVTTCDVQHSGGLSSHPDSYGDFLKIGVSYGNLDANLEQIKLGNTIQRKSDTVLQVIHNHEWSAKRYAHALVGILIADGFHASVSNCN